MKNIFTACIIMLCTISSSQAQTAPVFFSIFFDKGASEFNEEQSLKMYQFLNSIKDSSYNIVVVKGYADSDGLEGDNLYLSEQRVDVVYNYISQFGYQNCKKNYYGEKNAINRNANEDEKSLNRRVDILFNKSYKLGNKKKEAQVFYFKPNQEISFIAKEGTKIIIPANTLQYVNGTKPSGEIKIEITEFYSMEDIIQNKLTTTNNQSPLISAGMIEINASKNNQELVLKPGINMQVGFAEVKEDEGFGMFYGTEGNNDAGFNWVPAVDMTMQKGEWQGGTVLLFISDTVSIEKRKFENNQYGQKIRVTQTYTKATNSYIFDTTILDKKIYVNQILLESSKLGWLNCDKFFNETQRTELYVNIDPKMDLEIMLVFKNSKSMLAPIAVNKSQFKFTDLPMNEDIVIIGIGTDGEKLYFTAIPDKTAPKFVDLKMQVSSIAEIEKVFASFNTN